MEIYDEDKINFILNVMQNDDRAFYNKNGYIMHDQLYTVSIRLAYVMLCFHMKLKHITVFS